MTKSNRRNHIAGSGRPEERECCHPRCESLPQQMYPFPIPLCARHIVQVLARSTEVVAEARKDHMVKNGRELPIQRQALRNRGNAEFNHDAVVYYIRFGNRVKIGTTTNLRGRLNQLPHDEVLAIEAGGRTVERQRHNQFANLRVNGEWFELDDRLSTHIATLRQKAG